ncbi:hypothetical protein D5278_21000 [bacterium 1XD21-13]|nr:hypothetical protein [bacterium 1XD21-13]
MDNCGEILIYQSEDGLTKIEVKIQDETVWLTQQQMADLFQTSRTNVVEHIAHIYEEFELDENSTCRKFRQVRKEGNREVSREISYYNLDMIISLGYRVKSRIATNFRRLKDIGIAKNYLSEDELKILNNIVSGYFDFAECQAEREQAMTMKDWAEHLDRILTMTGESVIAGRLCNVKRK